MRQVTKIRQKQWPTRLIHNPENIFPVLALAFELSMNNESTLKLRVFKGKNSEKIFVKVNVQVCM